MSKLFIIFIIVFSNLNVVYPIDSFLDFSTQEANFLRDDSKNFHNITDEVEIIPANCTIALDAFSEKIGNLTHCTVLNARPIRVCINCEKEIKETQAAYEKLRAEPSICQEFYFASDQIGIIDLVYSQGEAIWMKNNCGNCYNYPNDTARFFNISRQFDACVKNANKTSEIGGNNTCASCQELFGQLNDLYNLFVLDVGIYDLGGVCMDIVDQMNITRHFWATQNCITFDSNIGYPNIVTAVLVGAIPIFFYMLSKNVSIIEDVKLVRPKRKSFTPVPSGTI